MATEPGAALRLDMERVQRLRFHVSGADFCVAPRNDMTLMFQSRVDAPKVRPVLGAITYNTTYDLNAVYRNSVHEFILNTSIVHASDMFQVTYRARTPSIKYQIIADRIQADVAAATNFVQAVIAFMRTARTFTMDHLVDLGGSTNTHVSYHAFPPAIDVVQAKDALHQLRRAGIPLVDPHGR